MHCPNLIPTHVRFKANDSEVADRNQLRTDEVIGVCSTTSDWSSNEANNAANQANQAINPSPRRGQWLIPYQRSKSILMSKLFQGLHTS